MIDQVYKRISELTGCEGKEVWNLLNKLQKEQAPHLNENEIQDCVILSLVRTYNDYQLSWQWFDFSKSQESLLIAA